MKTGVQRTYKYLKGLDSGFRRNDRKAYLQTFYEIIRFKILKIRVHLRPNKNFLILYVLGDLCG